MWQHTKTCNANDVFSYVKYNTLIVLTLLQSLLFASYTTGCKCSKLKKNIFYILRTEIHHIHMHNKHANNNF
jgi:hypothetical protein